MNIEQIDNSRILISLCDRELIENYHISYDKLGTDSILSGYLLKNILTKAEEYTGVCFSNQQITIEATKYDHGCIFLICIKKKVNAKKFFLKERSDTYTFFFENIESLISCADQITNTGTTPKQSMIYYDNLFYYLVIPRLFSQTLLFRIISEYCIRYARGKFFAAALNEHSNTICSHRALETLSEYF